ncbi:MAG: efflux RND transporter periplasmic adaptor subunit [Pseudomonadales bacterium]|nr:efflux RND transporter periplasmic adaptor subunit [Pseudomonadales bacterium]MCP5343328.1 efflux RND transporter periplasmic adaptor subunit [Pseudomonadales bacterium]
MTADTQDSPLQAPSSRRQRRKRWPMLLAALVVGAGAFYYFNRSEEVEADKPLIATVEVGSIINTISSAGTLKPSSYVDVGAQVSGQLEKLYVEVGDIVEEGQLLAEIDARAQQSRVEASRSAIEAQEAQVASRKASLELAKTNAARQERLMAANATSQLDYDNAITSLASAQSSLIQLEKQIEQARASLATDETELEYTRIYAPIAGTVVSIEMNEGRTLNANQQAPTILRIADLTLMTVEAEISEADIGNLKKGMEIYFTTLAGGNRRWTGTLRQILPTPVVESNVVLYTGLFDVENQDGSLLPEMTAQVFFITSAARNVLTVPLGALSFIDPSQMNAAAPGQGDGEGATPPAAAQRPANGQRPAGMRRPGGNAATNGEVPARRPATVRIVQADGSEEERRVVVGITSRVSAEIINGLQEGDQVIAGIVQAAASAASARNQQATFGPPGGFGGFR